MFYSVLKAFTKNSRKLSLKRGEILYHEGDLPHSLYLVDNGLMGLFHISENGKETFLRAFGENSLLGYRSYLAEEPYHATSIALSKAEITLIAKEDFYHICQSNKALLREMSSNLAKDLREAELRLAGLQDKSANIRITESLVFLKLKYPNQVWTRKEIAEHSCSTFETVTRVMGKLEDLNLITKKGRDFEIHDPQKLLQLNASDF